MESITSEQISTQYLGHLGVVAATIEKLGLIEKIDKRLPMEQCKITHGERATAMIMNGLGFINDRLYIFPEFLADKPIKRLFGRDISPAVFNDDALGRCLDAIADYGVTKLFSEIAIEIGIEHKLLGRSAHVDTTTLSLYGEYPKDEEAVVEATKASRAEEVPKEQEVEEVEEVTPWPEYGFSKDKRFDLKQMVCNLTTTGKAGFPVFFQAHSGNESDKKIMLQAQKKMARLCKAIKEAPSFLIVGDSAIYDACVKDASELLWLTRVPETHKLAKDMVELPEESFTWTPLGNGYKMSLKEINYKKVEQRWAVIYSEQAYNREIKTLDRKIKQDFEETKKAVWHLSNKLFSCEKDAESHIKVFKKKLKYHEVITHITKLAHHEKPGRPKAGDEVKQVKYKITGDIVENKAKLDSVRNKKGRFILATSQLDKLALPDNQILAEYKEQSKTESGFKFIKSDTFGVSSVFLKTPSRITALMMIMVLSLMVYAFAQHYLRSQLEAKRETLPDQRKKATNKPTMSWIFRLLNSIQVVIIRVGDSFTELVSNLDDIRKKIIRLFGDKAMAIYGVT